MKILNCVIFLSLLSLTSVVFLKKGSEKAMAQDDLTPDQIVKQYIDSAIKGNEEGADSLTTGLPDSYSTRCRRIEDSDSKINIEMVVVKPAEDFSRDSGLLKSEFNVSEKNPNDKFFDVSAALLEAQYIYATHSIFKNIKILETKVYRDEAIVNVEYIVSATHFNKRKFFLKNVDGWKIFTTAIPNSVLDDNENYATPRPLCGQKKD